VSMAGAVLVFSILTLFLVPELVAKFYARRGDALVSHKAWSQAVENYNRALTLRPTDTVLHYKIAAAYDKSQQFDRAMEEYKVVVAADDKNFSALNNLARLYLIQGKEPFTALRLLERLDPIGLPPEGQYAYFKNRGWAKFELGDYEHARSDLEAGLRVNDSGIAAHFLRGRALAELKRPEEEALAEFKAVIQILQGRPEAESELEPDWILYAQRQLLQGQLPQRRALK